MGCTNCKIGAAPRRSAVQQAKSGGGRDGTSTTVLGPCLQLQIQGGNGKYHEFVEDHHSGGGTLPLQRSHTASPTPEMTPRKALNSYAADPLAAAATNDTSSTDSTDSTPSQNSSESDGWKGNRSESEGMRESEAGRDSRAAKNIAVQGKAPVERLCTGE